MTRPLTLSVGQLVALHAARLGNLRRAECGTWRAGRQTVAGNSVTSLARRSLIEIDGDRAVSSPEGAALLIKITNRMPRLRGPSKGI